MGINEKMAEALSDDVESVIDDSFKFKAKMNIGDDAFKVLKAGKYAKDFFEVAAAGTAGGGLAFGAWSSSLGVLGGIGAAIGVVTTPVGWIAAATAAGAAGAIGIKKVISKTDKVAFDKVPKYINTPIDLLGAAIASVLIPFFVKFAYSDCSFSHEERERLYLYFVKQWGFNRAYITAQLDVVEKEVLKIDYEVLKKNMKAACKQNKDLKYKNIRAELLKMANDIIDSDNVRHPKKIEELKVVKQIF